MYVLNDVHLGVKRTAGTTPASQVGLRNWQFAMLDSLLERFSGPLLINGDLFDQFDVDNGTLLKTYDILERWLSRSLDQHLTLVAGNHDLSKDSSKVSAFDLLSGFLLRTCRGQVQIVRGEGQEHHLLPDVWIVPHVANQDLFDEELKRVPKTADFVLLHCNYDNHFAEQSDHSLNLSQAQAEELPGFIVMGHEHQQRFALDERVVVVGNQIPTSVSDCLGPANKYYAQLEPRIGGVRLVPWMDLSVYFTRLDWRALPTYDGTHVFIRVEGEALASEAAEVITAIAKFRARSTAFVITNAVSIEGGVSLAGVVESLQDARSFDVIEAILAILDEREVAVVKRLMGAA